MDSLIESFCERSVDSMLNSLDKLYFILINIILYTLFMKNQLKSIHSKYSINDARLWILGFIWIFGTNLFELNFFING